jgi:hypothetical protein
VFNQSILQGAYLRAKLSAVAGAHELSYGEKGRNNSVFVPRDKRHGPHAKSTRAPAVRQHFLEFPALSPEGSENRKKFWEDLKKAVEPNLIQE